MKTSDDGPCNQEDDYKNGTVYKLMAGNIVHADKVRPQLIHYTGGEKDPSPAELPAQEQQEKVAQGPALPAQKISRHGKTY